MAKETPRIGQILRDMGVISDHDVEEILVQQRRSRQKFGQIARTWGLARPEQIWEAWCRQLVERGIQIDLNEIGVDTHAVTKVDREFAFARRVLPVRLWGEHLVVALPGPEADVILPELAARTRCRVHHCFVDPDQLSDHLERAYAAVV
jgi:hypothetical protein